jgi:DNA adenine methylase
VLTIGNVSIAREMSPGAEPFLKWAGGKRWLVETLIPILGAPEVGKRYIEPFLGGGAAFFALSPKRATLCDVNEELIEAYEAVRNDVEAVIRHLAQCIHDEDFYYSMRSTKRRSPAARAARFIYLNKTCFNGLFRVNTNGEFNVPFGRHNANLEFCNREQLRAASVALANARLKRCDFEAAVASAKKGDVVYFDPPYTLAHENNGFIEYNARVFSWADQKRLAAVARQLVRGGVRVVVSNANHSSIRQLYSGTPFTIRQIPRWSTMAGSTSSRFSATELLITGVTR